MHGAAKSLMESVLTGKQLGQCAVYNELDSKLFYIAFRLADGLDSLQSLAFKEVLHVIQKLLVIQLLNTGKAFCKDLAVASVAAECKVLFAQQISLSNCCRFLAKGKMSRTRISSIHIRIFCLCLDLI